LSDQEYLWRNLFSFKKSLKTPEMGIPKDMLGAEPATKSFFLSTAEDMVRQKDAPQV